jgi:hypothetical protein
MNGIGASHASFIHIKQNIGMKITKIITQVTALKLLLVSRQHENKQHLQHHALTIASSGLKYA